MSLNWNGIAPFNEPCELAPGWPESIIERVTVSGICKYCNQPFTRVVMKTKAGIVTNCEDKDCKRERRMRKVA